MYMTKGNYVDGFVFVVPKKNFAAYKKMAAEGASIWKKYGALDYKECMGDDLKTNGNPKTNFIKLAKAKSGETVWFSYIVFKNKKHRDSVNKKVMEYYNKKYPNQAPSMPFDMGRMAYGGFSVIVG